jgi:hypothetical protein
MCIVASCMTVFFDFPVPRYRFDPSDIKMLIERCKDNAEFEKIIFKNITKWIFFIKSDLGKSKTYLTSTAFIMNISHSFLYLLFLYFF